MRFQASPAAWCDIQENDTRPWPMVMAIKSNIALRCAVNGIQILPVFLPHFFGQFLCFCQLTGGHARYDNFAIFGGNINSARHGNIPPGLRLRKILRHTVAVAEH